MNETHEARWVVYIIRTESGRLYTGITTDLRRRFSEHAAGKRGAHFFRTSRPEAVVYEEPCADRSEATARERAIKSLTRPQKLALINECPP